MYYNYHAKAKKLIADGHLIDYDIVDQWNGIKPALVLYFDNHKPMPIRSYRWDEYLKEGELKCLKQDPEHQQSTTRPM